MRDQAVLRVVCKMLFPFMLVFGLYVILHGELSPGGGFQGGVAIAAAFVLYGLIFGSEEVEKVLPNWFTDSCMALGAFIYAGTAMHNLLAGGNFLDYAKLNPAHPSDGEALGMTLVEYGVGITVSSVMLTIYLQVSQLQHEPNPQSTRGEAP